MRSRSVPMDWQANLDAIIKCTDENLRLQFETHKFPSTPPRSSYSSVSFRPPSPTVHFQSPPPTATMPPPPPAPQSMPTYMQPPPPPDNNASAHDYSSFHHHQAYNVANMMEQLRYSIKLEVDARAAIAERQLSAIMALTKSNSDELDRLRLEANTTDREVRGLDQTQQKLRQDMTTQKDIMYHVQSMAGKDESWRMQADNQLLELRQMNAALREQLNSLQVTMQEKLSRPELLVHFNACVEPLKAQLNAGIQHQAQIIGELSRSGATHNYVVESIEKRVRDIDSQLQTMKLDVESIGKRHPHDTQTTPAARAEPLPAASSVGVSESQVHALVEGFWLAKSDALETKWTAANDAHSRKVQSALDETDVRLRRLQADVDSRATNDIAQQVAKLESRVNECHDNTRTLVTQSAASSAQNLRDEVERERSERKRQLEGLTDQLMQLKYGVQDSMHKSLHELRSEIKTDLAAHDKDLQAFCLSATSKDVPSIVRKECSELQQAVVCVQKDVAQLRQDIVQSRQDIEKSANAAAACQLDLHASRNDMADQKLVVGSVAGDVAAMKKDTDNAIREVKAQLDTTKGQLESALKDRVEGERTLQRRLEQEVVFCVRKSVEPIEQDLRRLSTRIDDVKTAEHANAIGGAPPPPPGFGFWPPHMFMVAPNQGLDGSVYGGGHMMSGYQQPTSLHQRTLASHESPPSGITLQSQSPPSPQDVASPRNPVAIPALASDEARVQATATIALSEPKSAVSSASPSSSAPAANTSQPSLPREDTSIAKVLSPPTTVLQTTPSTSTKTQPRDQVPIAPPPTPPSASAPSRSSEGGAAPARVASAAAPTTSAQAATPNHGAPSASPSVSAPSPAAAPIPSVSSSPSAVDPPSRPPALPQAAEVPPTAPPTLASPPPTQPTHKAVPTQLNSQAPPTVAPPSLAHRSSLASNSPPPSSPASPPPPQQPQGLDKPATAVVKPPPPTSPPPLAPPPLVSSGAPARATTPSAQPTAPAPPPLSQPLQQSVPAKSTPPPPAQPTLHRQVSSPSLSTPPEAALKEVSKVPTLLDDPSMKGALAEAELAKARVENRLKIERERRHTLGGMSSPTATESGAKAAASAFGGVERCAQCNQEVPKGLKHEHELLQCPMRMQTCPTCQQSTRAKDFASHLCDKPMAKCKHCLADVADVADHEAKCEHALKQCPHCLRRQKMADLQDHINNCDCRLVQCPNACGGKFLQRGLEKHVLTKCPKRPQPTGATANPSPTTTPPPSMAHVPLKSKEEPKASSEAKVECKYCDEEFTASGIDAHEQSCDWKPRRCQFCNMVIISRDLARHEGNCKQSNRQCAHCQQSFTSPAYASHVPKCLKRPIKCIRCGELFAADIIVAHSTSCKPGEAKGSIPPPPSTPPPAQVAQPGSPSKRKSEGDLRKFMTPDQHGGPSDRSSRRNFALSQLTAPQEQLHSAVGHGSTPDDEDDNEEDEVDDDDDDDDMDDVTLAQVVAEWNVDHVCLWLREDVGVPDVVDRFEALQIDGQMLLELDERALVNDLGVKAKASRDRILAAIDAIKTSEDDDDDDNEDDEEDEEVEPPPSTASSHGSSFARRLSTGSSPQTQANLLNRINSALNSEDFICQDVIS